MQENLSQREIEIIQQIANGCTDLEIGALLEIIKRTSLPHCNPNTKLARVLRKFCFESDLAHILTTLQPTNKTCASDNEILY